MSNYGNRNSKMPDTSPMTRTEFTGKQVVASFLLVILIVGLFAFAHYAFTVNHDRELEAAVNEAKASKLEAETAIKTVVKHEAELIRLEADLSRREAALKTANETLESDQATLALERRALENEKSNFYAKYERVFELTTALSYELDPNNDEDALIIEDVIEDITEAETDPSSTTIGPTEPAAFD